MAVRNITKQKAGLDDLTLGVGTEAQTRNGVSYDITKVDIPKIVDTITDMITYVDSSKHRTCLVLDSNRGGLFKYDVTQVLVNNEGTIIYGWVRQYDGIPHVKWFGDTSLQQTWVDSEAVSNVAQVDPGTYTLDGDTVSFTGKKFVSLGSVTINVNTTLVVADLTNPGYSTDEIDAMQAAQDDVIATKIEATDYATPLVGGTLKARFDGTTLFLTNDGTDA